MALFSFELIKSLNAAQQQIYYWLWKNKSLEFPPRGPKLQIETKRVLSFYRQRGVINRPTTKTRHECRDGFRGREAEIIVRIQCS